MPSFVGIQEDCERIMRQVEERLEQRVQDPATSRSDNNHNFIFETVLRIRDVYPGSEVFPSRVPDPHQRIYIF
jgi:hypothetical protein